jgi:acyl-CoA dehydrogenase
MWAHIDRTKATQLIVKCRSLINPQGRRLNSSGNRPSLFNLEEDETEIREAVRRLCGKYPNEYWRNLDKTGEYPTEFVKELGNAGFLHTLIPTDYGGSGQAISAACAILEEIHASGGNGGAAHAQLYMLSAIVRFGSERQKEQFLPMFSKNELRFQAFGVTESESGSDTLALKTKAVKRSDGTWTITGRKMWTSRALYSDLMLVLARTSTDGPKTKRLSTFLVDLNKAKQLGTTTITKIDTSINHNTCEVFFDEEPNVQLLGLEGQGFSVILSVLNAERALIASECIGDGRFFVDKILAHTKSRVLFGKPLSANQGVQFPISSAFINLEAAALATRQAAKMWEYNAEKSGPACMVAKHLASEASWQCGEAAMQYAGGISFAKNFDVERKWRETRLFRIAPISTNLILAHVGEKVLGMPKSY